MTQPPPIIQGPFHGGYQAPPNNPAASVLDIVCAVLQIVFSVIWFFAWSLVVFVGSMSMPISSLGGSDRSGAGLMFVVGLAFLTASAAFFAAAIGIIRFKRWAFLLTGTLTLLVLGLLIFLYAISVNKQELTVGHFLILLLAAVYATYCFFRAPRAN